MIRDRNLASQDRAQGKHYRAQSHGEMIRKAPVKAWLDPKSTTTAAGNKAIKSDSDTSESIARHSGEARKHREESTLESRKHMESERLKSLGLAQIDTGDIVTFEELKQYQKAISNSLLDSVSSPQIIDDSMDKIEEASSSNVHGRDIVMVMCVVEFTLFVTAVQGAH